MMMMMTTTMTMMMMMSEKHDLFYLFEREPSIPVGFH